MIGKSIGFVLAASAGLVAGYLALPITYGHKASSEGDRNAETTAERLTLLEGQLARTNELLAKLTAETTAQRLALLEGQFARNNELLAKQIDYLSTMSNRLSYLELMGRSLTRHHLEGDPAAGLEQGEARVVGVRGDVGRVIPVVIGMNFPNASSVRFGNTSQELSRAPWQPYARTSPWNLPSGGILKKVHIEWRSNDGKAARLAIPTPAYDEGLGFDYSYAPRLQYDPRVDDAGILMSFNGSDEHWVSYANDGKIAAGSNVFYPVTWNPSGGAIGGYVWTDSSRWMIDTPEEPDSVLALMTYGKWSTNCATLAGAMEFSFHLRGEGLDLKGGELLFWVTVGGKARFHKSAQPLVLNGDGWTRFGIAVGTSRNGWRRSWARDGADIDLDWELGIDSFGISIVGFRHAEVPTGLLAVDEVRITPLADFACRPQT